MNTLEFIHLAGRIVSMGASGARSAVSRAYYGAFNCAQDVLYELVAESRGHGRSHSQVPKFLKSVGSVNKDAKEAASLLEDLHGDRIKADYYFLDPKTESQPLAMSQVVAADECHKKLLAFRDAAAKDRDLCEKLRAGIDKVKADMR